MPRLSDLPKGWDCPLVRKGGKTSPECFGREKDPKNCQEPGQPVSVVLPLSDNSKRKLRFPPPVHPALPFCARLFLAILLLGWLPRDMTVGDKDNTCFARDGVDPRDPHRGLSGLYHSLSGRRPVWFFLIIMNSRP